MKHARSDAHRAHKAHKARPTGTERIIGATCATCATPGPLTAVPIATTDLTLLVEAMLRTIRALALTAPGPQARPRRVATCNAVPIPERVFKRL